jgi:tRNA isopentenyl-2-thiomethyl-A-37 hydroxylase MiaE
MTTQERQAEIQAYREYPTRAGTAMAYHVEESRRYKYIYISSALRKAIGEGSIAGLKCRLDGKEVRLFYTRYGRSQAHHYKAYAKYADDWSPVKTADLHRITDVTLNN